MLVLLAGVAVVLAVLGLRPRVAKAALAQRVSTAAVKKFLEIDRGGRSMGGPWFIESSNILCR
jgi:hypothetical protein